MTRGIPARQSQACAVHMQIRTRGHFRVSASLAVWRFTLHLLKTPRRLIWTRGRGELQNGTLHSLKKWCQHFVPYMFVGCETHRQMSLVVIWSHDARPLIKQTVPEVQRRGLYMCRTSDMRGNLSII